MIIIHQFQREATKTEEVSTIPAMRSPELSVTGSRHVNRPFGDRRRFIRSLGFRNRHYSPRSSPSSEAAVRRPPEGRETDARRGSHRPEQRGSCRWPALAEGVRAAIGGRHESSDGRFPLSPWRTPSPKSTVRQKGRGY